MSIFFYFRCFVIVFILVEIKMIVLIV